MSKLRFDARPFPVTRETRWRFRFAVLTVLTTTALLAWGAFVTSINAGMAVPDWPTSFNSMDPFNPWPQWWTITPVLAEHGHRLLATLVGMLTIVLAVWTWRADPRAWMRRLGFGALALVIFQGVLGGLRVVFVSLDLAVVHACVAQLYYATLVAMALFTSAHWLRAAAVPVETTATARLRTLALTTAGLLYIQIVLGALLRHPGTGIDPLLAGLHITGATLCTIAIVALFAHVWRHHTGLAPVVRTATLLLAVLGLQVALGFTAYFVTLDETGVVQASNLQVVVNTTHMVVGAVLMSTAACLVLMSLRRTASAVPAQATRPARRKVAPAA